MCDETVLCLVSQETVVAAMSVTSMSVLGVVTRMACEMGPFVSCFTRNRDCSHGGHFFMLDESEPFSKALLFLAVFVLFLVFFIFIFIYGVIKRFFFFS